jgi:hypothetical protein
MPPFEKISPPEFCRLIAERASVGLRGQFSRYDVADHRTWGSDETLVHRGPLILTGTFRAPAFNTLVLGDVFVEGLVDLDDGHDEGGLFVALGHVECNSFANTYGKCAFVDGSLEATELVLNAFSDSSLTVIKNLRTRFFYGLDIWAEVGGRIEMDYGEGYCLPIGYRDAARQAIHPRHGSRASRALLNVDHVDEITPHRFLDTIRRGKSVFRAVRM